MSHGQKSGKPGKRLPVGAGLLVFLVIIVFFLWQEHRVHITGALPWILLALCPLVHVFMHRGHHHDGNHEAPPGSGPDSREVPADTSGPK